MSSSTATPPPRAAAQADPRPYRLSRALHGHTQDIKSLHAVRLPGSEEGRSDDVEVVLTASRDSTCRTWYRNVTRSTDTPGPWRAGPSFYGGGRFLNAITFAPARTDKEAHQVILGGLDADIRCFTFDLRSNTSRVIGADEDRDDDDDDDDGHDAPTQIIQEHHDNVTCLRLSQQQQQQHSTTSAQLLASASWDSTARSFRRDAKGRWGLLHLLKGHTSAVWGVDVVCASEGSEVYLTSCADLFVRLFEGEEMKVVWGGWQDVVRTLRILPPWEGESESGQDSAGAGDGKGPPLEPGERLFASTSNDAPVLLHSLAPTRRPEGIPTNGGDALRTLEGHQSIVYDCCALPRTGSMGEHRLVTASEDGTARVWHWPESCLEHTLYHPVPTVWAVSVLPCSGDVVTGSEDGVVRVFTQRIDDIDTDADTDTDTDTDVGHISPAERASYDGACEALAQRMAQSSTVVAEPMSSHSEPRRQTHPETGEEYDLLLPIDLSDDAPEPLLLGINDDDDPETRAREFLQQQGVESENYVREIVGFVAVMRGESAKARAEHAADEEDRVEITLEVVQPPAATDADKGSEGVPPAPAAAAAVTRPPPSVPPQQPQPPPEAPFWILRHHSPSPITSLAFASADVLPSRGGKASSDTDSDSDSDSGGWTHVASPPSYSPSQAQRLLLAGDSAGLLSLVDLLPASSSSSTSQYRPLAQWQAHQPGNAILRAAPWRNFVVSHGRDNKIKVWRLPSRGAPPQRLLEVDVNSLNFCGFDLLDLGAGSAAAGASPPRAVPPPPSAPLGGASALLAVLHTLESGWVDVYHLPSLRRVATAIGRPSASASTSASAPASSHKAGDRPAIVMSLHLVRLPSASASAGADVALVAGYEDGSVQVWVPRASPGGGEEWTCAWRAKLHGESVLTTALALLPSECNAATIPAAEDSISVGANVRVRLLSAGADDRLCLTHVDFTRGGPASSSSSSSSSSLRTGTIHVNAQTRTLSTHKPGRACAAFFPASPSSPHARALAQARAVVGGWDGHARVYALADDSSDGDDAEGAQVAVECTAVLRYHKETVQACAVGRVGRGGGRAASRCEAGDAIVALGGKDGRVSLWSGFGAT